MYCILLKDDSLLRILRFPGYFETLLFRNKNLVLSNELIKVELPP